MKRKHSFLALLMVGALPAAFAAPLRDAPMQDTATSSESIEDEPEERGSHALRNDRARSGSRGEGGENASDRSTAAARALWQRLDADHDGRISAAESRADSGFNASFAELDSDRDGYLSGAEYAAYRNADAPVSREEKPPRQK